MKMEFTEQHAQRAESERTEEGGFPEMKDIRLQPVRNA
jgi:hypothetical protein